MDASYEISSRVRREKSIGRPTNGNSTSVRINLLAIDIDLRIESRAWNQNILQNVDLMWTNCREKDKSQALFE